MFLLDAPYVSRLLLETVERLEQPVLDIPGARKFTEGTGIELIDNIEFAARLAVGQRVLSNSENALAHIFDCGCYDELVRQIDVCKDKALFRETVAEIHPEYAFKRVGPEELETVDVSHMPLPFVVKPARGFFSLGVHVVNDHAQWPEVVQAIRDEREQMNANYPEAVVNAGEFLIEEGIEGDEYAIDVYYDENGDPVITNILFHHFVSDDDISDRLYYTSTRIIRNWLEPFTEYTAQLGRVCGFRNFPMHLEVRVDEQGHIQPIEANPLRFAGWCVADITIHAWGFNPYEYFFENRRPDWPGLLAEHKGEVTVMVIGDVPAGTDKSSITSVDYDGFQSMFSNVLELRRIDYSEYPVFAFAFARMDQDSLQELKQKLTTDFARFLTTE